MDHFFTIDRISTAECKDRGSRFIAIAFPIKNPDDFKQRLQEIKKEHPKAVHHCFAYRLGTDGNQFRSSDDGEPSGTAGKPILGQIDSRQLTDMAVVVVRYFGGTLLGVPGLIQAYKTATSLALQTIPIIQKPVLINYEVQFDYTMMNDVMQVVRQCHCEVISQEIQLFCRMRLGIPKSRLEQAFSRLSDLRAVEINKIMADS